MGAFYHRSESCLARNLLYHLRATAESPDGNAAAQKQLQDLIAAFAVHAVGMPAPTVDEIEKGFNYADPGHGSSFECVALPDRNLWTACIQYPDELEGIDFVWTLNVSIVEEDERVHFGLKIEAPRNVDSKKLQLQLPLLDELLELGILHQVCPLDENLWRVNLPAEVPDLIRFLESPDRHLSVVVISAVNRNQWSFTQTAPLYLINAEYLAAHTKGFAFVVQLGYAAAYEFSNTVGRNWAVFDGAVRIYLPYLSFKDGNPRDHRSKLKGEIWFWTFNNQTGSSVYTSFLIDSARYWEPRNRLNLKGLSFVPDARVAAAERELRQISAVADPQEREKAYLRTIDALQKKLSAAEEENAMWSGELARAEESAEFYQKETYSLRAQLNALRGKRPGRSAEMEGARETAPDFPKSMLELGDWVREHLDGKLLLLPDAERSAEASEYQDVPTVCRALQILANEYRSTQTGSGSNEAFLSALQRCGMTFSGFGDGAQYGDDDRTYLVNYPPESDHKVMMRCHVFKGHSRDSRYTLKIYFFWDAEKELVVVGSLPGAPDADLD